MIFTEISMGCRPYAPSVDETVHLGYAYKASLFVGAFLSLVGESPILLDYFS